MHNPPDQTSERLVRDVETAFANLTQTFSRLTRQAKRTALVVRRLEATAATVAQASEQKIVQVERAPPCDENGARIKRPRGRPRGSATRAGLTLFATEAQVEALRAQLAQAPAQPER